MSMIQTAAMFQDAAPVAAVPAGKGAFLALHSSGKNGAFAKALQVSSSSSDEAADDKVVQKDAQASTAGGAVSGEQLSLKRRSGQSDSPDVEQLKGGNDGNEQSASQLGSDGGVLGSELQLLTAAVPQTAPATDATLVTAAEGNLPTAVSAGNQQETSGLLMLPGQNAAPAAASTVAAAEAGNAPSPLTSVQTAAEHKLAIASQQAVQLDAVQLQATAAPNQASQANLGLTQKDGLAATKDAQANTAGAGTNKPEITTAVQPKEASAEMAQAMPKSTTAVAPGARQSAAVAYLFPERALTTSKPVSVTAQNEQVVPANQGMDSGKGQLAVDGKAAPVSQEAAQVTVAQAETGQIVTVAPSNGPVAMDDTHPAAVVLPAAGTTQKEVPVASEKAKGAEVIGSIAAPQPLKVESSAPEVTQSADKGAQLAADKSNPLTAEGFQKPLSAEKTVAEQVGAASKAPVEQASETKFAAADLSAKGVSLSGNSAQAGSDDADKKGHSEQKAQDKLSEQVQPLGIGVQSPVITEAVAPESKQTNLKSALHESILSQVKDGVVTHDGKGNGQMSIRLNPGELGELKIEVRMVDNRVKIEVQANNPMVKDLLMSNLGDLKQALTSKNFTMEGFDVSTGGGGSNQLSEERRNPQQQPVLWAKAGGYQGQDEGRVNYVTADVNNLLDVKF